MTRRFSQSRYVLAAASAALVLASCGGGGSSTSSDLTGNILIDGSSTVAPLMTLLAEDFQADNSGVRVTVGTSGTGGGFEKFCAGETDLSNASRAIKDEEAALCAEAGIEFIYLEDLRAGIGKFAKLATLLRDSASAAPQA